jgi:ABC-2 type transport system ATP-binding protein
LILETRALTRRFGSFTAVDSLDLEVGEGDIFGFLGPNGAGKTTTIRMLLRLIPRTAGDIRIFGLELDRDFLAIARQIGAIVEEPAFYPYLSGRENLKVFGRLSGGVDGARVDECLDKVGLLARGGDKVRVYSQGMRQRLGIAQALLARPRLLFLDEPTNGLDPPGIQEMRRLLTTLAREEKVTVFVSSHLLNEVEVLCNRVAILNRGRLVVQGEVARLLETDTVRLEIGVEGSVDAAAAALAALGHQDITRGKDPQRLVTKAPRAETAALCRALVERGIGVTALIPRRPTLEEYFREQLAIPIEGEASGLVRIAERIVLPEGPGRAAELRGGA